jgi:hypothetical protein
VYDDAIEAEGANRNVRIWGNYLDRVFVPIANAATSIGPLYVWRKHRIRAESRHRGSLAPNGSRHGGRIAIAPSVG